MRQQRRYRRDQVHIKYVPSMAWRASAACKKAPLELFITPGDDDDEPFYPPKEALEYCNSCPVKAECYQYAVDVDAVGVFGGTSTYQRRQLASDRDRVKCPSCGSTDLIYENGNELCVACGMSWHII